MNSLLGTQVWRKQKHLHLLGRFPTNITQSDCNPVEVCVNTGHPNNLMIDHHFPTLKKTLGGLSHLISGLVRPSYRWIHPTFPTCFRVIIHLLTGMSHKNPPEFVVDLRFFLRHLCFGGRCTWCFLPLSRRRGHLVTMYAILMGTFMRIPLELGVPYFQTNHV